MSGLLSIIEPSMNWQVWFDYSLSDFLMYTQEIWLELLSYYHASIWPVQMVAFVLSFWCLGGMFGLSHACFRLASRALPWVFALSWFWLGLFFQWHFYRGINWLGSLFAGLFCFQGCLMILSACFRVQRYQLATSHRDSKAGLNNRSSAFEYDQSEVKSRSAGEYAGLVIYLFALIGIPVVTLVLRQRADQAELIFVTPDATALATIGMMLTMRYRESPCSRIVRVSCYFVPFIWCLFSILSYRAMATRGG